MNQFGRDLILITQSTVELHSDLKKELLYLRRSLSFDNLET